jgi:hypothetical protein
MRQPYQALVWIDHHQAKVFQFDATEVHHLVIHSTHPHQHLHHKANSGDSGHAPPDKAFLRKVAESLATAGAVLLVGPGSAKTELAADIGRAEPADHPTDAELVALGRSYFEAKDPKRSQSHSQ